VIRFIKKNIFHMISDACVLKGKQNNTENRTIVNSYICNSSILNSITKKSLVIKINQLISSFFNTSDVLSYIKYYNNLCVLALINFT
jgi:hypothetical protein